MGRFPAGVCPCTIDLAPYLPLAPAFQVITGTEPHNRLNMSHSAKPRSHLAAITVTEEIASVLSLSLSLFLLGYFASPLMFKKKTELTLSVALVASVWCSGVWSCFVSLQAPPWEHTAVWETAWVRRNSATSYSTVLPRICSWEMAPYVIKGRLP